MGEPRAETLGADDLAQALAGAGLIQFGRFAQPDGVWWPVALHLGWLPSYPDLLRQTARALAPLLDGLPADRVLAGPGALPVAVALGLETGMPVVYMAHGPREDPPAFAIEGAYDVGHPTALLFDVLWDPAEATTIAAVARRVGLEVHTVIGVIDPGLGAREALEASGWDVRAALALPAALPALEAAGALPPVMRASVQAWIEAARSERASR